MNASKIITFICGLLFAICIQTVGLQTQEANKPATNEGHKAVTGDEMQLGNFSVSLTVKDLKASMAFYEKLDFKKIGGAVGQNYVILQNGTTTIGLFQGMFESNILTFNPGWNHKSETLKEFQDVREIQATLKGKGVKFAVEADVESKGPASFVIVDPDGNSILVDQHVAKPN